jgi:hypothetical protein
LHQLFIARTKGVCGLQLHGSLVALFPALQGGFNLYEGVAVATVQIHHRLFALIKQLSGHIHHLVAKRYSCIFFNFHGLTRFMVGALSGKTLMLGTPNPMK